MLTICFPKVEGIQKHALRSFLFSIESMIHIFLLIYRKSGTWVSLQNIEMKRSNARSWQMKITETKREWLKHACPINCPPKTCLKVGASGNVNPRKISTYKIDISMISDLTTNHYDSMLVSLTCKSWHATAKLPNFLLYFFPLGKIKKITWPTEELVFLIIISQVH